QAITAGRPQNFQSLPETTRLMIDRDSVMPLVQQGRIPSNSPLGQAFGNFSTAVDARVAAEKQFATQQAAPTPAQGEAQQS
ncbi:MAG TPA: hypothetical protein VGO93_18325, partial [Candidatus Xenobia bacterium]